MRCGKVGAATAAGSESMTQLVALPMDAVALSVKLHAASAALAPCKCLEPALAKLLAAHILT